MASPIPVPAPVTIAILSFKRIDEPFPARSVMALRAASRPTVLKRLVVLKTDLLTQLKIAVRLAGLMAHEDGANRHDDSRNAFPPAGLSGRRRAVRPHNFGRYVRACRRQSLRHI